MRIKGSDGLLKKCNLSNNDLKRKHIPIRNRYWKKEKMRILHKIIENNSRYFIDNYWGGGYSYGFYTR